MKLRVLLRSGALFCFLLLITMAVPAETPSATELQRVKNLLPEFEAIAEKGLHTNKVPGMAIAIVYKDQVIYLKGYGVRKAGENAPVDPDTVFQIASVSKPFTSTVLAALVGDGTIGWDDKIIGHDPEFRLYDEWVTSQLTIRDLLSHRSGLPSHAGDLLEDLGYDRNRILYRLRFLKPASSFRSTYAYANFGITEAAIAAAQAVGKEWEALAAERLYQPLGMDSTSSRFEDYAKAGNRSAIHVAVNGKMTAIYVRNPDAQAPAGGVSSTARDIAQWMRLLQLAEGKFDGRQLIDPAALRETHRPQIVSGFNRVNGRALFYGLGWGVDYDDHGRIFLKHSGAFTRGIRSQVALLPDRQVGIAILTNAYPSGLPEALSQVFFDLFLNAKVEKDWVGVWTERWAQITQAEEQEVRDYSGLAPPKPRTPALPVAYYQGTYRNDYFGPIEIAPTDKGLKLFLGPGRKPFPLTHWNRDIFTYEFDAEMGHGTRAVIFTIGAEQQANRVLLDNLNVYGNGVFKRIGAER